jgi:hypothetical protein
VTPEDLAAYRRYARAYCRWRCGGALPLYKGCPPGQTGRGKLDPVYVEETEGRDDKRWWDKYSSCGDLSQGLAWHLGVRKPYVNRATMRAKWIPGRNLLHFYDGRSGYGIAAPNTFPALHAYVKEHGPPAIKTPEDYRPLAGDIGFIWSPGLNNAHTFVFGTELQRDGDVCLVETFNYGAGGMTRTEYPGGHVVKSTLDKRSTGLWLGKRKLQFVAPLSRLLADSEALPFIPGEVVTEMEERVP